MDKLFQNTVRVSEVNVLVSRMAKEYEAEIERLTSLLENGGVQQLSVSEIAKRAVELDYIAMSVMQERITAALKLIAKYGQIDGAQHKDWLINKILWELTGGNPHYAIFVYDNFISKGEGWNSGVEP
jgi:hypothetical protein